MRTRTRLIGLLATLILLGIVIGLPATLLALGANPIPRSLPTLEQLRSAVTTPDDGTLALGAIKVIAWASWIILTGSILLEITARLRHLPSPRIPGLSVPQGAARRLVTAALLLFVISPASATIASAAPASPASAATPAAVSTTVDRAPITSPSSTAATAAAATKPTYTVRPGDTLTGIAERELGDSERWHDIAELNPAVARHPDLIHVGTVLVMPSRPPAAAGSHTYVVRKGDTLSGIAERELGDADKYPLIFEASRDTVQPGGGHLVDPDVIDVGQTLTIPTTTPAPPPAGGAPAPSTPAPAPPPSAPRPARPDHDPADREPAGSVPVVPSGAAQASPRSAADPAEVVEAATPAPWALAGLTGAGAILAGSLLTLLRRRRHAQFRNRRPGRTLAAPAPELAPVEKTVTTVGGQSAPTVERIDDILRRLAAASSAAGQPMPVLAAVELTATHLVLHLADPAQLPAPWEGTDDGLHWKIAPETPLDLIGPRTPDQPAPYPLLVTIGLGDHEQVWLLNIEDLNVTITGDPTYGQDFARYLAAEVACNPWSAGVQVACLGVAAELGSLNPDRIHVYDPAGTDGDPIAEFLADAVATVDRVDDADTDVTTARSHQVGSDAWPARLLLVDAANPNPALDHLIDLVHAQTGRTATSVVVAGPRPSVDGVVLHLTDQGRITLPEAGLDLVAVGLTSDEALGCASLLAHGDTITHIPVPVDEAATQGWRAYTDEAGALRADHTLARHDHAEDPATVTLLDESDETYLQAAATTAEDLQVLAPRVSHNVREDVEAADPTLDDDLAMWRRDDSALPKLVLLGPVRATTRGKPLIKRKPYMTELLAFIALRRLGATTEEVADTFGITKAKARDYVLTIRQWLGTNPRTKDYHLPDARLAPAAAIRDVPVYQVIDLLIDADLFRRLRVRGEARGGQEGIADLRAALSLVQGRPFDFPVEREQGGGWAWLLEGDRIDEHLTVAIVDVAHVVTTHALAAGDLRLARMATETAALAAPYEEIPRLDLAAVAAAEGHHAEAQRIIRDEICNRTDDDNAPPELPTRTEEILRRRQGWTDTKAS
jgi:LysM repeat protein